MEAPFWALKDDRTFLMCKVISGGMEKGVDESGLGRVDLRPGFLETRQRAQRKEAEGSGRKTG